MTSSESRRTISTATLAATAVATLVMAVWGFHALTAPIEKDPSTASSTTDGTGCTAGGDGTAQVVRRGDVTVSVYNAGRLSGRAQDALDLLENAGFRPGAVGNAPTGSAVPKVQVRTTKENDAQARLVALAFGKGTVVTVTPDDLGPGIDVFVGDKFKRLDKSAPKLTRVTSAC